MQRTLLLLLFGLTCIQVNGQRVCPPPIQWQQTFGGSQDDRLSSIARTSDGGFVLGGYSDSGANGNKTSPNYGGLDFSGWLLSRDHQIPIESRIEPNPAKRQIVDMVRQMAEFIAPEAFTKTAVRASRRLANPAPRLVRLLMECAREVSRANGSPHGGEPFVCRQRSRGRVH